MVQQFKYRSPYSTILYSINALTLCTHCPFNSNLLYNFPPFRPFTLQISKSCRLEARYVVYIYTSIQRCSIILWAFQTFIWMYGSSSLYTCYIIFVDRSLGMYTQNWTYDKAMASWLYIFEGVARIPYSVWTPGLYRYIAMHVENYAWRYFFVLYLRDIITQLK